jgi:predicted PurR-regulated permease PerM
MGYTNVATTSNESVINLAFLICTLFLGKASAPKVGIKVKRTCPPFDRGFMHPILRECNAVFRMQCLVMKVYSIENKTWLSRCLRRPPIIPCN